MMEWDKNNPDRIKENLSQVGYWDSENKYKPVVILDDMKGPVALNGNTLVARSLSISDCNTSIDVAKLILDDMRWRKHTAFAFYQYVSDIPTESPYIIKYTSTDAIGFIGGWQGEPKDNKDETNTT